MKLYYLTGACSLASNIALRDAGLKFELVKVDRNTRKAADGLDFNEVNPKGYVPVLTLDNGEVLTENVAVLQYIADRNPGAKLAPAAGTMERYRLMEWLSFINSEIHKSFSPLFNPGMPEEGKQIYRDRLANRFGFVNGELAGKDYVMGDHFTVADAYLYTVTRWAKPMAIDLTGFPNLVAFLERVSARPAVQEALKHEKLS